MNIKVMTGIFGGLIGLVIGAVGGGFIGLIIGGTFFGLLEILNYPQMPGYELSTYIGIILGVLIATPLGVIIALRVAGLKIMQD